MKKSKIILFFFAIVIIGTFLRFYNLGENSFVADEFLDINSSYAYHQTGVWQSWDFNRGIVNVENAFAPRDERAWMYKWQVAELFKFLPPTEAVARSVSALWGVLTIAAIFFVARDFTKQPEIGLLSAFLFAVSISGIIFDRRLRMYAMFFPIFLLLSWMIYKFLESEYKCKIGLVKSLSDKTGLNLIFIIPAVILAFVSFNIHQLSGSIIFILGAYLLIQAGWIFYNKKSFANKYIALIGIGVFGAVLIWFIKPSFILASLSGIIFFENHWSYIAIAFSDYSLIIAAILTLLVGIYYLAKIKKFFKEALWLSINFFVPFLMAIFLWNRNAGDQYLFFAKSFLIILIASGIYAVADFLRKNLAQSGRKYYFVTIILFGTLLPNYAYFFEESNTYHQTSNAENPNYRSVFNYFKKNKSANDVLVTRNFRNYYWSGAKVKTFDFGGELTRRKFSLADLQKIMNENPSGWFIYSDNDSDYISNDAEAYAEVSMQKINAIAVRGKIKVYRWGNS